MPLLELIAKPEIYSAIAAAISAGCALFTVYVYRSYGKGFIWVKDNRIDCISDEVGNIHLQIEIPLFNLGKGLIKFISLDAKKINLESKAMENFRMDMHEAYFPESVPIVSYKATIHTTIVDAQNNRILISQQNAQSYTPEELKNLQENLNNNLSKVPEHVIILKCTYKDGSWFNLCNKTTVIGFSVKAQELTYLSNARRKELNEYFSW